MLGGVPELLGGVPELLGAKTEVLGGSGGGSVPCRAALRRKPGALGADLGRVSGFADAKLPKAEPLDGLADVPGLATGLRRTHASVDPMRRATQGRSENLDAL